MLLIPLGTSSKWRDTSRVCTIFSHNVTAFGGSRSRIGVSLISMAGYFARLRRIMGGFFSPDTPSIFSERASSNVLQSVLSAAAKECLRHGWDTRYEEFYEWNWDMRIRDE